MIYVTHDQTEALTFADKVVVMYDGASCRSARPKSCSSARAYLRRLFHRLARHEPAAREGRGTMAQGRRPRGDRAPGYGPATGKDQIGVRPEFVPWPRRRRPAGNNIRRVEDVGRHKIVRAEHRGTRI
jgi:glycerol transport system ATP-binding protein